MYASLRGERVTVERRQPIETTATPGTGAFEERVVEVRETAEEPVVAKTARVTEEVVVGREATERTETVRDTVRREEVEVTDNAGVKHRILPPNGRRRPALFVGDRLQWSLSQKATAPELGCQAGSPRQEYRTCIVCKHI